MIRSKSLALLLALITFILCLPVNAQQYIPPGGGSSVASSSIADQTITAAGTLTLAHGLGVAPKFVTYSLVCQTGELGYTSGQVVSVGDSLEINDGGFSAIADSTNLVIRFGPATNTFALPDATTGAATNITNSKWKIRFYCQNAAASAASGGLPIPVTVVNGGTGVITIPANGIVLGAGASPVTTLAPGAIGNVATSDGTHWTSAAPAGGGGSPTNLCTLSNIPLTTTGSAGTYICTDCPIQAVDSGASVAYYGNGGQLLTPPVYSDYTNYGVTAGCTFTSGSVLGFTVTNPLSDAAGHVTLTGKALTGTPNHWTVIAAVNVIADQTTYAMVGLHVWDQAGSSVYHGIEMYQGSGGSPTIVTFQSNSTPHDFSALSNLGSAYPCIIATGQGAAGYIASGKTCDKRLVYFKITCDGVNRTFYFSLDGITWTQQYQEAYNAVFTADSYGVFTGEPGVDGSAIYRQAQVVSLTQSSP